MLKIMMGRHPNQTYMISFKDIELTDKELITSYTLKSPLRNCDLSFANLCSWRFLYNTKFAIVDDFLVLKFWVEGEPVYMMPVGEGDFRRVLNLMIEDVASEGAEFYLLGVCDAMRAKLEETMPGMFGFESDRQYTDYLYLREELATLAGKKFQAKRNHVNNFVKTYDFEYVPLTAAQRQECLDLEAEWCKRNNCDQQEGTGNERRALVYALHHFDELGLTGGMLRVDGRIVAFTYGTPINGDTFGVHIEKADTTIEGAYAMINREFAKRIPEQYTYVNREEDLGIEGLRKAKLSYHPVILLDKYTAYLKNHPMGKIKW